MYQDIYKIKDTLNLDGHSCFHSENTYPKFQEELIEFKNKIKELVDNKESVTFYKFGDGDYRFLKQIPVGSAKPGNRAISKSYEELDMNTHIKNAQLCDYYTCEIYPENRKYFKEVIQRDIDYPAEFGYGLVANKWLLETFKGRIGLIGAEPKLKLIEELLKRDEYKDYLGLDYFNDYIYIPQKFAADDIDSLENIIKPQLENSNSDIFLVGMGHSKNGILHKFTDYKRSVYLDVGGGIDMIAGCINTRRPYAGSWVNYRIDGYDYSKIDYMNYNNGNEKLIK